MKLTKSFLLVLLVFVYILSSTCYVRGEEVDTNSPQFAAQSESKTFNIKYNDAEKVAVRLREAGVKIKVLKSKNLLVVQALSEKMKEIEKKLKKIDSPANPYQVKYDLYVIELKSEVAYGLGLREMELKNDSEDNFNFLTPDGLVELAGKGVISYLRSRLEENKTNMERIAHPSLVTAMDRTASISLNREVISLVDKKEALATEEFSLKLTPENIIEDSEEILTTIDFKSSSFINSELSSNVKTKYNKAELIAVFSQRKGNSQNTSLKEVGKEKQSKYFALYLAARPVGSLSSQNSNAFNLGGLDNILGEKDIKKAIRERVDILYNSSMDIDISVQDPENREGFIFEINDIDEKNAPYLQFGPDFYLMENLKLGTYFQVKDEENRLKIGFKDRVKLNNGIRLSAGYYPWFYSFSDKKIVDEKNWWFQSELKYKKVFLDLKYNEIEKSITENSWRGLVGCQIIDPLSIVVGVEKDEDEEKNYIGGFTLKSW
ncbi:MAG: hypothetical protein ACQEQD_08735 [Bacillota bacterium]